MKPLSVALGVDKPRFADYFDNATEARLALYTANDRTTQAAIHSREFLTQLTEEFEQYGLKAFLSIRQFKWLCDLINK